MIIREYEIQNLTCPNCSNKIEESIKALPEVNSAQLDFMNRKLVVQYHEEVDTALERLNQIAGAIEPGVVFSVTSAQPDLKSRLGFWLPLGAGVAILAVMHFVAAAWQPWLGLFSYLLVGHRVLLSAARALWTKQLFAEHFLMSVATLGALYLGEYLEAGAVMVLYEIGLFLENRALEHSRRSVKSMLALKPEIAHLQTAEGIREVKLAQVHPEDVVLVYAGERIPLDGVVQKGESTVDTSTLTGEAEPLPVAEGIKVFAGFMNNSGLLEIRVTSTEAESTISRILNLIENATARKSSQEKFITRFARYYTPAVVLAALLVFLVPTLLGSLASVWLKRSLVFLIVSCPCALVISIPLTYFISIGIAARHGIILKGSNYLDILRRVKTVVFDKTGTLTTGRLRIEKLYVQEERPAEELIAAVWLCEYTSTHPFAVAVKEAYQGSYDSRLVSAYSEYPGRGILLQYDGDRYIVGSEAFLSEFGFVDFISAGTFSAVHAVKNDFYLGCITFSDEIKSGIREVISALKTKGIERTVMLSGDRQAKAGLVSQSLGLDEFHAELLPSHKLEKLEQIMAATTGKVAYVGDGMNDAPTLARADVGLAMGSIGNQASIEAADIVLLNDQPRQLAAVFELSRRTGFVVAQNIVFALAVKALVMGLGISGISGLWEAIIADVGVTLLVVFNSLRMLRSERRP